MEDLLKRSGGEGLEQEQGRAEGGQEQVYEGDLWEARSEAAFGFFSSCPFGSGHCLKLACAFIPSIQREAKSLPLGLIALH